MSVGAPVDGEIGGGWLTSFRARPGEVIRWSAMANRTQGDPTRGVPRAVGGKLFLTNQRVLFTPHRLDYLFAGEKWEAAVADIQQVDKEPHDRRPSSATLFSGALRDRLRLTFKDGSVALFVVNNLDDALAHFQQ